MSTITHSDAQYKSFAPHEVDAFIYMYNFYKDTYERFPNVVWVEISTVRNYTAEFGFRPDTFSDFEKYYIKAGKYFVKSPFTGGMAFNVVKFERDMKHVKAKDLAAFFLSITPVTRDYACSTSHWRDFLKEFRRDYGHKF